MRIAATTEARLTSRIDCTVSSASIAGMPVTPQSTSSATGSAAIASATARRTAAS